MSTLVIANILWFFTAALFEIAGCYAFWMWLKQDKNMLWALAGIISLIIFALILTKIESEFAGRAYAAYGGIYILSSLLWLNIVESEKIIIWDYIGATLCLIGASIIFIGPKLLKSVT